MRRLTLASFALLALPTMAHADVKSAGPAGFEVESTTTVPVAPAEAYAALGRIGQWWSAAHTYSGDAANMTIGLAAGGCFCEAIPADGGSVEHGRVILAWPGRMLRFRGGLGPIQAEGATGVLTWTLEAVDGGTRITQNYVVGGPIRGGAEALAPLVDQVLIEQLEGLSRHVGR